MVAEECSAQDFEVSDVPFCPMVTVKARSAVGLRRYVLACSQQLGAPELMLGFPILSLTFWRLENAMRDNQNENLLSAYFRRGNEHMHATGILTQYLGVWHRAQTFSWPPVLLCLFSHPLARHVLISRRTVNRYRSKEETSTCFPDTALIAVVSELSWCGSS